MDLNRLTQKSHGAWHDARTKALRYVQAVPTMMIVRNGEVISRRAGAASAPMLRQWVDEAARSGE